MMKVIKIVSVLALFLSLAVVQPSVSHAEVSIDINIGPPPFFPIPLPPALVVIPGSYIYFAPEIDMDVFFYQDYWYRPHRNEWYRSRDYNGPWSYVVPKRLPAPFHGLPPGFRNLPPRHDRIPYKDVKRNWRSWEKKRHWDRDRDRDRDKDRGRDRDKDRDRGERKGKGKRR